MGNRRPSPFAMEGEEAPQVLELRARDENSDSGLAAPQSYDPEDNSQDVGHEEKIDRPIGVKVGSPMAPELLQSIQAVKEKIRLRVPVKLSILKIEVSGLPKAHRFVRNRPWVKAQYGGGRFSWSADYIESEEGDHSIWSDLNWSFTVERNHLDRQDLVIAICSKDLIIGRYVLGRDEISELAESAILSNIDKTERGPEESDFVTIEGEIINALGPAGQIHILCSRQVMDSSLFPTDHDTITGEASVSGQSTLKGGLLTQQSSFSRARPDSPTTAEPSFAAAPLYSHTEVTVRLLSAAVMDLHAVHFLQANSPSMCVDTDSYVNVTDARPSAGMAAKWPDLFWRFAVSRDRGMVISVMSNSVMIGKCVFATEELISVQPTQQGVVSIVKLLSNGRELTGKIKINMLINQPEDLFAPASVVTQDMRESAYPTERPELSEFGLGSIAEESEEVKEGSAVLDMLPPQLRIRSAPFTIVVQEITVLDVKLPSLLQWLPSTAVPFRLHLGCGAYAYATKDIQTKGRFAHWLDMVWKVPVPVQAACLRVTLWSRSTGLGEASLSVPDLLGMPTTRTGRTEIFTIIHNEAGDITGKVRLACHYERGLPPIGTLSAAVAGSTPNIGSKRLVSDAAGGSVILNKVESASPSKHPGPAPISPSRDAPMVASPSQVPEEEPLPLAFPLSANIQTISLVDLLSLPSSLLSRPSVSVQVTCDRKQATTPGGAPSGGALRFHQVDWTLLVRKDSLIILAVISKGKQVAKTEIDPQLLLSLPVSPQGTVQMSCVLRNDGGSSAGKAILTMVLKNTECIPDLEPSPSVYSRSAPMTGAPVPSSPSQTHVGGNREETYALLDQAHGLPRMPWTAPAHHSVYTPTQSAMYGLGGGLEDRSMDSASIVFDPRLLQPVQMPTGAMDVNAWDFKVSIAEVDLWDLAPMHNLQRNCPFVSAACGKWASTTSVQENAGSTCFWSGLTWACTIADPRTRLRLTVQSRNRILGAAHFSVDQLTQADTDNLGYKRLQGVVLDKEKQANGKIKISFTVEVHKKTHVVAAATIPTHSTQVLQMQGGMDAFGLPDDALGERSLDLEDQSLMGGSMFSSMPSQVMFPCTFTLDELVTMELMAVHAMGRNVPSIKVQCGNFYHVTPRNADGLELSTWRSLGWRFPIDRGSAVRFTVVSRESVEVGIADLDVGGFADIPPNLKGLRETMLVVKRKGVAAGKLVIRAKLSPLEDTYHDIHLPAPDGANSTVDGIASVRGGASMSLPPIGPPPSSPPSQRVVTGNAGSVYARARSRRGSAQSTMSQSQSHSQAHTSMQHAQSMYMQSSSQLMPATPSQHPHSMYNMVPPRSAGSPSHAGLPPSYAPSQSTKHMFSTREQDIPAHLFTDNNVDASDDMSYLGGLSVTSSHPGNGSNGSRQGASRVSSANVVKSRVGSANPSVPQHLSPPVLQLSMPQQQQFYTQPSPLAASPQSSQVLGAQGSQYSLYMADVFEQPLKVTVFAIYAVELKKAHTFSANSPTCAIACGKYTVTTPELKAAGSSAQWEDLLYAFSFERKSNLRLLFVSKESCIGFATFGREKFINGKPSSNGRMVVLGELMDENKKPSGKVKIIYGIDLPAL